MVFRIFIIKISPATNQGVILLNLPLNGANLFLSSGSFFGGYVGKRVENSWIGSDFQPGSPYYVDYSKKTKLEQDER